MHCQTEKCIWCVARQILQRAIGRNLQSPNESSEGNLENLVCRLRLHDAKTNRLVDKATIPVIVQLPSHRQAAMNALKFSAPSRQLS